MMLKTKKPEEPTDLNISYDVSCIVGFSDTVIIYKWMRNEVSSCFTRWHYNWNTNIILKNKCIEQRFPELSFQLCKGTE